MSSVDPRAPVIVGGGQITHRDDSAPLSPLELMSEAANTALADSGSGDIAGRVESVAITDCISWPVPDPGRGLAVALGLRPAETVKSAIAGTSPIELLRDAAARIQAGELDVALLAGAEATRSLARGTLAVGQTATSDRGPTRVVGLQRDHGHAAEQAAGLYLPIAYYPLFEHALRASRDEGLDAHLDRVARLWARFAEVARDNPHAWVRDAPDAETIRSAGPRNRPIAHPYTKLMTANIHVDQGAAIVLCSAAAAESAGVPRDRWVFVACAAGANDHWFTVERDRVHRSPAIAASARAAFGHAGVGIDDIAHVDLYSCFPSAVQIAAAEIDLDLDADSRTPTVTGGLTFAGGPASNYPMHSLATLSDRLRADPGALGLATGVGWFMTKHAIALLSADPPRSTFADLDVQREVDALPRRTAAQGARSAPIETYTVLYDHDGTPANGIVSCLTTDGSRALAESNAPEILSQLLDGDPIGREASVDERAQLTAVA